jgi:hypothetical protein
LVGRFSDNDIQEIKDVVRIGIVSSVNAENRTARVKIRDNGIVTGDLKILYNRKQGVVIEKCFCPDGPHECKGIVLPWIPEVNDWVLCIFVTGGDGDGFIVGGI